VNSDSRISNQVSFYFFILLVLNLLPACGKKQRDIFSFKSQKTATEKVHHVALSSIKNLHLFAHDDEIHLSWKPLSTKHIHLIGYRIYGFQDHAFISREPLATVDPKTTTFTSKKSVYTHYTVSALFSMDGREIEGPKSKIISL